MDEEFTAWKLARIYAYQSPGDRSVFLDAARRPFWRSLALRIHLQEMNGELCRHQSRAYVRVKDITSISKWQVVSPCLPPRPRTKTSGNRPRRIMPRLCRRLSWLHILCKLRKFKISTSPNICVVTQQVLLASTSTLSRCIA